MTLGINKSMQMYIPTCEIHTGLINVMVHFSRSDRGCQTSPYFDFMDAMMGTKPTIEPLNYADTEELSVSSDHNAYYRAVELCGH